MNWLMIGVVVAGTAAYILYEWRREIRRFVNIKSLSLQSWIADSRIRR